MKFEMATVPLPRSVLAVALATAMLGSRVAVGQLLPPGAGAALRPNADCDTFSALTERVRALDAECPGAPQLCTVACGAALFPFLDACGSFVDVLNVFDDADGTHDGRAGTFVYLARSCAAIPSAQLLGVLEPLWSAGQCPDDWMEGVGTTAVEQAACVDARGDDTCKVMTTVMSCETDLCPTCGMAGTCDATCGFCTAVAGGGSGHRLQEVMRQLQIQTAEHACPAATFDAEAQAVNDACCDAATGGCAGVPTECDARCGVVFVDFYARCADLLRVYSPADLPAYTQLESTCSAELPAEPLLRLIGRCTSHDTDIPSCQAKIATGVTSCFIYLQQDALALGTMQIAAEQYIEVHGLRDQLLQVQADWSVASTASLVLADLHLVDGSGSAAAHFTVETGGQATLQHVQMDGANIAVSGTVSVVESTLTNSRLLSTSSAATLSLSGGSVASSTVSISSGSSCTMDGCTLSNSPVTLSGAAGAPGTLSLRQCQLQSDGSSIPLTVQAGGSATVRASEFQSTAGDDITAVSVDAGGTITVGESQLVHADGRADPLPCNGTLPTCAGVHAGPVEVVGPAVITLASPLVCDALTGECIADLCALVDCGAHGTCVSPLGSCTCRDRYEGERCEALPCCSAGPGGSCNCHCGSSGGSSCSGTGCSCYCGNAAWCNANQPGWSNGVCDPSC